MRASHRASAAVQLLTAGKPAQHHPWPRSCVPCRPQDASSAQHEHQRALCAPTPPRRLHHRDPNLLTCTSHRAAAALLHVPAEERAQQRPRARSCVRRPPENAPRAPHEHHPANASLPPPLAMTASQDNRARRAPRIKPRLPCSFSQPDTLRSSIPGIAHARPAADRAPYAHRTSTNAIHARRLLAAAVTASKS